MKLSYKQKLFIYFFIVFAAFTVVIIFFQQNREKAYKTETLRTTLDDYSDIIARYVQQHQLINNGQTDSLKNVLTLMPSNLRLTMVDHDGKVLYDNSLDKEHEIENHLLRPEIQTALIQKNRNRHPAFPKHGSRVLLLCQRLYELFYPGGSPLRHRDPELFKDG